MENKGLKYDDGKIRLGLVLGGFAKGLWEVGCIGTFGAKSKYGENTWQNVENSISRYTDALLRHLFAHLEGETIDPESGYRHLAHCAWNILAILTLTHKKVFLQRNELINLDVTTLGDNKPNFREMYTQKPKEE